MPPSPPTSPKPTLSTLALHADASHPHPTNAVIAPLYTSTVYSYPSDPTAPLPEYVYTRCTNPTTTRYEAILSSILHGHATAFGSGLAALHAILLVLKPPVVSVGQTYHGTRAVLELHRNLTGMEIVPLDCALDQLKSTGPEMIGREPIILVETPVNPTGEAIDLELYRAKAHQASAILVVDSTLAAPPIQDPFAQGADVVFHSATKYLGGHSDLLGGVVAVRPGLLRSSSKIWLAAKALDEELKIVREVVGNNIGGLEGWLGCRSARTLELRVLRASSNAVILVERIQKLIDEQKEKGALERIRHASLQNEEWVRKQMPGGFGGVFAVNFRVVDQAKRFPGLLDIWTSATSLGGVESTCEWRGNSDSGAERNLVRFSTGVEGIEDLWADLKKGLDELEKDEKVVKNGLAGLSLE
ncbi:MAG: hypothetical protein M1814_002989 [Vezdaea aestivalis]|nr:MAG: hypothetical protein M1814_002989 [Vezdaea aestivalis]